VWTPSAVFTRARLDVTLTDEEWLPHVGRKGWAVIGRDSHILERPLELRAFLQAKLHMFLLPGSATRAEILDLLAINLGAVCTQTAARQHGVYWLTLGGLIDHQSRITERDRRKNRRRRLE
jgi:hypothetical protein